MYIHTHTRQTKEAHGHNDLGPKDAPNDALLGIHRRRLIQEQTLGQILFEKGLKHVLVLPRATHVYEHACVTCTYEHACVTCTREHGAVHAVDQV